MKYLLSCTAVLSLGILSIAPSAFAKPKKSDNVQKEVPSDLWFANYIGQSPNREVIYIDPRTIEAKYDIEALQNGTADVSKPPPFVEADSVYIYEGSEKIARINGYVRANCATQQMMFLKSWVLTWKTDDAYTTPPSKWFSVSSEPKFAKVLQFMCDPKARKDVAKLVRVSKASDPLDTTWATAWSDVQKPKFSTTKTLAEARAEFDKTAARSQAIIDKGTKEAMETRSRILRDEKVTAMEQKALFAKMRSKASPVMNSWLGAQERALVASWGIPSSSYDAAGARFVTYTEGYATQMQDQYGTVQPGSRQEFYCDMTFEIRGGVIKDYRSGGNYCGTASTGKPRGPN
jgi:hypothetical protein